MKLNGIFPRIYFTRIRRDFDEYETTHFILSFLFEKSGGTRTGRSRKEEFRWR